MAKIVVVEDDPTTLKLIKTILRVKGHRVFDCKDAKTGLRTILREEPDVAIIDYIMPLRDGLVLLKDIRSIADIKGLPVIMLTGNGGPEVVEKAIALEVTDFVVKPVKIHLLLDRLEKILLKVHKD